MIDHEPAVNMQGSHEASPACLIANPHYNEQGSTIEGLHEPIEKKIVAEKITWEAAPPIYQGYSRPMYRQDWQYVYSDPQLVRQPQQYAVENHYYQVNREYYVPVQYLPLKMVSQVYAPEVQLQEFQYFVVIDFEATCDKEKNPHPQEIIEFPSVLVNSATGQLEGHFQIYVRPMYHQNLTEFCKELTGIQQIQVDTGVPLSEALLMHDKWLEDKGIKQTNFAIVTWSNWDCRVMLESECRFKNIKKPPYFNRWINLRIPFQEVFGDIRCNLKQAVQLSGLVWEGRAHCGLDDARNTARLLCMLMQRGFKFSITNSLMWQAAAIQPMTQQSAPVIITDPIQQQVQKPKEAFAQTTTIQLQPSAVDTTPKDRALMYCHCGVLSSKGIIHKPGPYQGRYFFGCGQWPTTRRAACAYFCWASSS